MMRGQSVWAVAVRKPNGDVAQVSRHVDSAMARHRWLRIPVVRGVVALGESLSIGFRALSVSAQYAAQAVVLCPALHLATLTFVMMADMRSLPGMVTAFTNG